MRTHTRLHNIPHAIGTQKTHIQSKGKTHTKHTPDTHIGRVQTHTKHLIKHIQNGHKTHAKQAKQTQNTTENTTKHAQQRYNTHTKRIQNTHTKCTKTQSVHKNTH